MNIHTEPTPNPSSLKFLPGKIVMEKGTADFRNVDEAKRSPLALNLFKIDGVEAHNTGKHKESVKLLQEALTKLNI